MTNNCNETWQPVSDRIEVFPPCTPSINTFGKEGWICPKCGRAISPYSSCCPFCDGNYVDNIVYCGVTNESVLQCSTNNVNASATAVSTEGSNNVLS